MELLELPKRPSNEKGSEVIDMWWIFFPIIILAAFFGCERDTHYHINSPMLPELDCREYVRSVGADMARRGLTNSSIAKNAIAKAERECEAENRRRGY